MTYKQVWDMMTNTPSDTVIQRERDHAFIPMDEGNSDYQAYLRWLGDGNHPKPPEVPNQVQPATLNVYERVKELEARMSTLERR